MQFLSIYQKTSLKFKKRLHFCIKYTFLRLFLPNDCILPYCVHTIFIFSSFLLVNASILSLSSPIECESEHINCKTIQFIQKCFIFLLYSTMPMTTKQCNTNAFVQHTKKIYLDGTDGIVMSISFSLSLSIVCTLSSLSHLHFTLYFIIYSVVVVVVVCCCSCYCYFMVVLLVFFHFHFFHSFISLN